MKETFFEKVRRMMTGKKDLKSLEQTEETPVQTGGAPAEETAGLDEADLAQVAGGYEEDEQYFPRVPVSDITPDEREDV